MSETKLDRGIIFVLRVSVGWSSSDEDIAAMMNWLLATFSREQLPADFVPYTAQEVAALRTARIDVAADRRRVVAALVAAKELPSPDALSNPHASLY